jgi:hypothetical protein
VNGAIWVSNNKKTYRNYNDHIGNCKKEKEKSKRHRVLLLGDSQARGYVDLLKLNLNRKFGVSGFVKLGAKTSDI